MDTWRKGKIMAWTMLCSVLGFGCQPSVKPDIGSGANDIQSVARLDFEECAPGEPFSDQYYWTKKNQMTKKWGLFSQYLGRLS